MSTSFLSAETESCRIPFKKIELGAYGDIMILGKFAIAYTSGGGEAFRLRMWRF